jgi:hypothetical protein
MLLKRLRPDLNKVVARSCGNDYRVATTLPYRILEFTRVNNGGPVDKAIVVRDAHRMTHERALQKLRESINPRKYEFPIEFAVVEPEIEAWLLADHNALFAVSQERGVATRFPVPSSSPEMLRDPKEHLMELLAEAKVPYTEAVAGRLAETSNLLLVEQRCPSFRRFKWAGEHC